MFRRLRDPGRRPIRLLVDGETVEAADGDTVAAALLVGGHAVARRSAVSASPRAPYCLMGVCFECLVEIDGEPSRQACLVPAREGMVVRTGR